MAQPLDLSSRDRAILADLERVRLLTGRQLEWLHFTALSNSNTRSSARRRSLGRLVAHHLVTTLPRRVGGERAGSAGLVYALDAAGQRLLADARLEPLGAPRVRRPWSIGWPFVQHTLDVADLYVRLREAEAAGELKLLEFAAEPASWFTTPLGVLKPDAWVVCEAGAWEEHHWLEVDRATESLPTITRKLRGYVDFAASGAPGPRGVVPQVLLTVPTAARLQAIQSVVSALPPPAGQLIAVRHFAVAFVGAARPPPQ